MNTIKLVHEVDTNGPVFELTRKNNLIYAFDGERSILEIDIKHQLLVRDAMKYPPISVKSLLWDGSMQYFITELNKIEILGGGMVSESNSKA